MQIIEEDSGQELTGGRKMLSKSKMNSSINVELVDSDDITMQNQNGNNAGPSRKKLQKNSPLSEVVVGKEGKASAEK